MTLSFERYRAAIGEQTQEFIATVDDVDQGLGVPGCPGWTVAELVRHVGGVHRWVARVVGERAAGPVPDELTYDVSGGPVDVRGFLEKRVAELTGALADVGPDPAVWAHVPGMGTTFWARHATYETVVHRSDAAAAVGAPFAAPPDLAADGIDTWMTTGAVPEAVDPPPGEPPLLGPGRSLRLMATDAHVTWHVDLAGPEVTWTRDGADCPAAVTVRGPLTGLLLMLYRRRDVPEFDVDGDGGLLEQWLWRTGFWLRE